MLSVQEAKQISETGDKILDKTINDLFDYMFTSDVSTVTIRHQLKDKLIEIIECERLTAATLAIDKFYT